MEQITSVIIAQTFNFEFGRCFGGGHLVGVLSNVV